MAESESGYTDTDYIAGIRRGDETIFTALVRQQINPMLRFAFGFVGDYDVARDIVQEVFARIWHLRENWVPKSTVSAYLYTAVRHNAFTFLRDTETKARIQALIHADLSAVHETGDPYIDVAMARLVRTEFHGLTDRQRDALRLRYGHGQSLSQIATILGIEVRTAERLVTRGIASLRARLARLKEP